MNHTFRIVLFFLLLPVAGFSQTFGADDAGIGALVEELKAGEATQDLDLLPSSCRAPLKEWNGVRREIRTRRGKTFEGGDGPNGWESPVGEDWITPVKGVSMPATALLEVPEDGTYRIWLRRMADMRKAPPLVLAFEGANTCVFRFGERPLSSAPSKEQERQFSIRFEDEAVRASFPSRPTWIWEFHDAELRKGKTKVSLSTTGSGAKVGMLFLTRSKSFVPNQSKAVAYNNLDRVYYRIRVVRSDSKRKDYAVKGNISLTYHWRFIPERGAEPLWASCLNRTALRAKTNPVTGPDGKAKIPVGGWTDWIDATWSATGAGPWATAAVSFEGVDSGLAEVELAWGKHPAAVVKRISPRIFEGTATFIVPLDQNVVASLSQDPDGLEAVWGIFAPDYLDLMETLEEIHERFLSWSREAIRELGLREGHKPSRAFNFISGCSVSPAYLEPTAQMLANLGVNSIERLPPELAEKLGININVRLAYADWGYLPDTHDPADPAAAARIRAGLAAQARKREKGDFLPEMVNEIKLGDEIGPIAGISKINASTDCLRLFHDYLNSVLTEKHETAAAFFGVEDVKELRALAELPERAGLFQRRVYYHSELFKFLLSSHFYSQITKAAKEFFPNAHTYANYTPHPIVLGTQTMNWSEWFTLPRSGAVGMAFGECWASPGTHWSYHGIEIISYYAAWVECAARRLQSPGGFYVVVNQGAADHKTFSLASRNIRNIRLYSFGPRYAGAEYSNFWSDSKERYIEVARGIYMLGPADPILKDSVPEKRRVALLYNRPHEIMNGGEHYVFMDRALTFSGLGNAHYNADLILVEDLTPELLAAYRVLYLNGFNLPLATLPVLQGWVKAGGTLVAVAGTAQFDEYGTPAPEFARFFGTETEFVASSEGQNRPQNLHQHKPVGTVKIRPTEFTPDLEAEVVGAKFRLRPLDADPIASYEDGTCAGTLKKHGDGHVLVWGIQPGMLYKGDAPGPSTYRHERLPLLAKPLTRTLGAASVDSDAPQLEMTRFENEVGIAVLLNNFAFAEWREKLPPVAMRVRTDRQISSVFSARNGELKWQQNGHLVEIDLPLPQTVDTIIMK